MEAFCGYPPFNYFSSVSFCTFSSLPIAFLSFFTFFFYFLGCAPPKPVRHQIFPWLWFTWAHQNQSQSCPCIYSEQEFMTELGCLIVWSMCCLNPTSLPLKVRLLCVCGGHRTRNWICLFQEADTEDGENSLPFYFVWAFLQFATKDLMHFLWKLSSSINKMWLIFNWR